MEIDRKVNLILKLVSDAREPLGSAEIAQKLNELGINMSERTVRYHLKRLSEEGLMKGIWKEGRMITRKGIEELGNAYVSDKVGLISSKIESMAYKMNFDLYDKSGSVILNLSFFNKKDFAEARKIMRQVFEKKMGIGDMVAVVEEKKEIGGIVVPDGKTAFGTLCSINFNGILLKHSIPVESKFGGILQVEEHRLSRFTDIINYFGSTLDPHEIFIKSKMTNVLGAVAGAGKILAGLREIPAAARDEVEAIMRKAEGAGFGRVLTLGSPGQVVLGMPVGVERAGIVFPGGLNPIAAAEEMGIETESKALVAFVEYSQLKSFWDL